MSAGLRAMGRLLAVSGFAGAGKTTAADHMTWALDGTKVYLGSVVLDEIDRCGLEPTRENEQAVRKRLRDCGGPAVFVAALEGRIASLLDGGRVVLVDAIMHPDELAYLMRLADPCPVTLVALHSSMALRCDRLTARACRPFNPAELDRRDAHERSELRIAEVFDRADFTVLNDGSRDHLERQLDQALDAILGRPVRSEHNP